MASTWGTSWGTSWATSWNRGGTPAAVVANYQDPGFWTEEHRKIKELEEAPKIIVIEAEPETVLEARTEIRLPALDNDDDEIAEIIEMLKLIESSDDF